MATAPRAYQVTPAEEFVRLGLAEVAAVAPGLPAPEPTPAFGEVRAPIAKGKLDSDAVFRLVLHGARVHGAEGVVSVGRRVMAESLYHVYPPRAGAVRAGDVWMARDEYVGARIAAAEHLLTGNCGSYYHWLLDGLSRWALRPEPGLPSLLPATGPAYQRSGPALLPSTPSRWLAADQVIDVDRLGWISNLTSAGGAFHPAITRFSRAMAASAPPRGPASIYVSRRDSTQRPLRNEAAIEALCAARGYAVLPLSGLSVADQVAAFGAARRVIAPHGAGLANLVFCRPGAAVLELFMDQYVNFCFRRLAACAELRYGCVIGRTDPGGDPGWVHDTGWTLDPAQLASVLDDPAFAPEEEA